MYGTSGIFCRVVALTGHDRLGRKFCGEHIPHHMVRKFQQRFRPGSGTQSAVLVTGAGNMARISIDNNTRCKQLHFSAHGWPD